MEFHRGLIRAYDESTHTAAVLLAGSLSRTIANMPVSQQIGPELLTEGTACGVAFFAEGSQGVVVCTFDGAAEPWVTSDLIVDGTIEPEDLSYSPATPEGVLDEEDDDQSLTTTATTYGSLSQAVTVASGKTIRVLVFANVEFECTSYTNYNIDVLEVYAGSSAVGQPQGLRTNAVNTRASVTVAVVKEITADTTFYAKVRKALDRNTEVAHRGNMVTLWWEDTS